MDVRFRDFIDVLHPKYVALISMKPVTVATLPKVTPKGGVYLFSDGTRHLYAGRTKGSIGARVRAHVSRAPDCPFAWHLARKATGNVVATYKKVGSRKHLLSQGPFLRAYEEAKADIRALDVRYVEEADPIKQALLEIYVAVATRAEHNDFDTH